MLFAVRRITAFTSEQLPKLLGTLLDIEQVLSKQVDDQNIRDGSLITALYADGSVTPAKISGNPQTASGTYTGNGDADRTISLGFTPRYVMVARVSNGTIYEAIGDGTSGLTNWWRLAAGTQQSGAANWQGIVSGGFQTGSNAGSDSNVDTEEYHYVAYR